MNGVKGAATYFRPAEGFWKWYFRVKKYYGGAWLLSMSAFYIYHTYDGLFHKDDDKEIKPDTETETIRDAGRVYNSKVFPKFDPEYGFRNGRQLRESKVAHEDLERAGVQHKHRDYCAHHYLELLKCKRDNWPFYFTCGRIMKEYEHCEMEDLILRVKEYEREKRLLLRAQRKRQLNERDEAELLAE